METLIRWITHPEEPPSAGEQNHEKNKPNQHQKNKQTDTLSSEQRERRITLVSTGWGGGEDFDIELEEHDMIIHHVSLMGSDDYASSGRSPSSINHIFFTTPYSTLSHVIYPITHPLCPSWGPMIMHRQVFGGKTNMENVSLSIATWGGHL